MAGIKETALYAPVRAFLEEMGYAVQAEVQDCDIAAIKEGELLIVELKKSFNLKLVYQALERQTRTEQVFVAIPRPQKGQRARAWQDMLRLLKRLELGLLTVALDSPMQTVEVILEPADSPMRKNRRKREKLQTELENRRLDDNVGGSNRRKILTAFREKSIRIACLLEKEGRLSPAALRAYGLEDAGTLLYRNYDGWFQRIEKGIYGLSEKGAAALEQADYAKAVDFYRQEWAAFAPPAPSDAENGY